MDTDHQEYRFDGLHEGINYTFTVTQTGFISGGRVLSTGPVYARTFTTNNNSVMSANFSKQLNGDFSGCMVTDILK